MSNVYYATGTLFFISATGLMWQAEYKEWKKSRAQKGER